MPFYGSHPTLTLKRPTAYWVPSYRTDIIERLRAHGIPTTVRDTRGSDIDGACGQLAAATSGAA